MEPEAADSFPRKSRTVQRFATLATVAFAAALLVFVPMWLTGRACENERDAAQRALRLGRIENSLAAAAIQARRGDYEPARDAASGFFTSLRAELDRADPALPAATATELRGLLSDRDQIITLLARSDEAAAERLSSMYVAYRRAAGDALPEPGPAR